MVLTQGQGQSQGQDQDEEKVLSILRQVASDGELKNPSKTNKDTLVAIVTYVAPCLRVPGLLAALVGAVSEAGKGSETEETEEEDFFPANTQSVSDTPSESTQQQQQQQQLESSSKTKVPVCKSRWAGTKCSTPDCSRAHPDFCKRSTCKSNGRQPGCSLWHTVRTGNGKGRAAAPSEDPKSSKNKGNNNHPNTPRRADLKMQLLSSQLEAFRARGRLALLTKRQQQQRQQQQPRDHQQRQPRQQQHQQTRSFSARVMGSPLEGPALDQRGQPHARGPSQLPPALVASLGGLSAQLEAVLTALSQI